MTIMILENISLSNLKNIKNAVIGNPIAKVSLAKNERFIASLVGCLNDPLPYLEEPQSSVDDIRVEAAHIVASLSYGSVDALKSLLAVNTHQAFIYAISKFTPSESQHVKAAFARGLRALAMAIADAVGPSQWGLRTKNSTACSEARPALDYLFQLEVLDIYLPLLIDSSVNVGASIAQLLASTIRISTHRSMVSDWLPPAERIKEVKGKRGWEKPDAANSPTRQGGWVARRLTALLHQNSKVQEAALQALASLAKDNPHIATRLAKVPQDRDAPLSLVIALCKSRSTDLQLAACLCATHISRAGTSTNTEPAFSVIYVLNRLISSDFEAVPTRTKACFILFYLVTDNKGLCQIAFERGSLTNLAGLVKSITPIEPVSEWDEDEPDSISCLREAALTAIAAISLFENDMRREITDNLKLVPYIQVSLSHRHVGVRYAACQCVRALSRAVAVLQTNIFDSGLGMAVYQLFVKPDEDRRVTHVASSVVCNLVNDFSPLRTVLLEEGVMPRLVVLLNSGDPDLRLNALWATKNLLYCSSPEMKHTVMEHIGWHELACLTDEPDPAIREQAFHVIRHLAEGNDVDMVFKGIGTDTLLGSLANALESENEGVLHQAVCVLANLANSAPHQSSILAHPTILASLNNCLVDAKVEVRRPAISCVLELVRSSPYNHQAMHVAGIDSTLRRMCEYGGISTSPTARFSMGLQMGVEDDREVKDKAREALQWLNEPISTGGPL